MLSCISRTWLLGRFFGTKNATYTQMNTVYTKQHAKSQTKSTDRCKPTANKLTTNQLTTNIRVGWRSVGSRSVCSGQLSWTWKSSRLAKSFLTSVWVWEALWLVLVAIRGQASSYLHGNITQSFCSWLATTVLLSSVWLHPCFWSSHSFNMCSTIYTIHDNFLKTELKKKHTHTDKGLKILMHPVL